MNLRKQAGFSLLELIMVISISMIVAGITAISWVPLMEQQHVTSAYNSTLTTLRRARDQAAGDMEQYQVTFSTPGTITVDKMTGAGPVLVLQTVLPTDVTFHVEPGIPTSQVTPPTTPDGFGTGGLAFDFDQPPSGTGGSSVVYFNPDGTATDINGNLNNGVVYLARVGDLYSSRAITVWGSTGRIRGFRLYQNAGGSIWRQQ